MAADPIFKRPSSLTKVFCRVRNRDTSCARLRKAPLRIVEIGSWEGRSALFFLKYLPYSSIVCIDTFQGTPEESHVYAIDDFLAARDAACRLLAKGHEVIVERLF